MVRGGQVKCSHVQVQNGLGGGGSYVYAMLLMTNAQPLTSDFD